jgi:hypothetical protein
VFGNILNVPCTNSEVCTHRHFALLPLKQKNWWKVILDVKICASYFLTKYFAPVYSELRREDCKVSCRSRLKSAFPF